MRWNIFDDSRLAFNGSNGAISTFGEEIRDTRADKTPKLSTIDKNYSSLKSLQGISRQKQVPNFYSQSTRYICR